MKQKKNKLATLACVTVAAFSCLVAVPQTTKAASQNTEARKVYNNYLSKSTVKWDNKSFPSSAIKFSVIDLNNDNVPELYADNTNISGTDSSCAIFSYENGKMREIYHSGTYGSIIAYYPTKGVFLENSAHGAETNCYYKFSSGQVKAVLSTYNPYGGTSTNGITYHSGKPYYGTKISKSVYQGKKADLLGNAIKNKPFTKTNTSLNRTKYILSEKILPEIRLSKTSATLYYTKGKTLQLSASVCGYAKSIKWTSSNPGVVAVDTKGKVTVKSAGTATITAKAGTASAKCTIKIKKKSTEYYLKQKYTEFLETSGKNYKYFKIINCCKEKLPILLVADKVYPSDSPIKNGAESCKIYNFVNGKIVYVGSVSTRGSYVLHYTGNYLYRCSRYEWSYLTVSGKELITVKSASFEKEQPKSTTQINFYSNTAANRKKMLT